jgi:hypothetical protein
VGVEDALRQGMSQLCEQLVREQLALAGGSHWEQGPQEGEGGQPGQAYLPHAWRPFSALRCVCVCVHATTAVYTV